MQISNKNELDNWLFDHAQIMGHICDAVKGPLQGVEPESDPAELFNVAFIDRETGERFDVIYNGTRCPSHESDQP